MPTLGTKSKDAVKEYILEVYDIAHLIAPINQTGTDSANPDWKGIYKMANLSNAITRNFNHACFEAEQLQIKLLNAEGRIKELTEREAKLVAALKDIIDIDVNDLESGGECPYRHTRNIINNAKATLQPLGLQE